jgi:fluoroquinolone resistance protein
MTDIPALSGGDFAEQRFESLDLKAAVVEGAQFEDCTFTKSHLAGASFKRCRFVGCTFEHSDLSNVSLTGSSFRDVTFRDCKLVGVNWANAAGITHLNYERCVLSYANFAGIDLRKSFMLDCVAREADFADANLSEANFQGTDFSGARFTKTNLVKADLRRATNYAIRPDDNKIKKAKFSLPEATLLLYGLDIDLEE